MRRGGLLLAAAALAVLTAALPAPAAPGPCADSDVRASIVSSGFPGYNPATVDVPVGGTVCWTNVDDVAHTVTADNGGIPDSPTLAGTGVGVYRETFPTAATIPYHCKLHGAMGGTVRVVGGGGDPPPSGGPTGPGATDTPPRFSGVRVVPSRACTRRSRTCRRPGARARFTLDEPARVTGTLDRRGPGAGRVVRRFSFPARAGVNRVRLPLRRLRPGRYRLALRALDGAGNRSTVARASFTLLRR